MFVASGLCQCEVHQSRVSSQSARTPVPASCPVIITQPPARGQAQAGCKPALTSPHSYHNCTRADKISGNDQFDDWEAPGDHKSGIPIQ